MKSLSNIMLTIAAGVLADATRAYPSISGSFVKDIARLTRLVEHRGLGVFTLDLPMLDDLLLAGLEYGSLPSDGFTAVSKKVKVPRLFSGLFLLVFNPDGSLREDACTTSVAFLRQLLCVGKKLEVPCSKKRELAAIKEYVHVESTMRPPTLRWDADTLGLDRCRLVLDLLDRMDPDIPVHNVSRRGATGSADDLLRACQRIADIVSGEIGPYYPDAVVDGRQERGLSIGLKHGPGAVAERGGRLFNKYRFTNWSAKLERVYPYRFFGRMPNDPVRHVRDSEVPARLLCVPKTAKAPRIIAAEPSEHMFCQMLLKSHLEERVKRTFLGRFIDFKKQSLSASMVERSSLDQSLATVDLSSASDRLSLWLIERIFRKNVSLIDAIHASRTRKISIPQLGQVIELKKFASQGTAITFPIQTIVFLCIALAASCKLDVVINGDDRAVRRHLIGLVGKVRVYGDDIIIPVGGYVKITQLMHDLGLKVNTGKSFFRGLFRESCGQDSFKGDDVTPVKPKSVISENPETCVAVLDSTNNLFYKGYWNASDTLRRQLSDGINHQFVAVGRASGCTGFGSFSLDSGNRYQHILQRLSMAFEDHDRGSGAFEPRVLASDLRRFTGGRRVRWNADFHRFEVRIGDVVSDTEIEPYSCGYSGLLDSAVKPSHLVGETVLERALVESRDRGVPGRPRLRMKVRWVSLDDFVG